MTYRRTANLRDRDERDRLVLQFSGLPLHVARRMADRDPKVARLGVEDAAQAGFLGLIRAAEIWDADRGVKFISYAYRAVWAAIWDAAANDTLVPVTKDAWSRGARPPRRTRCCLRELLQREDDERSYDETMERLGRVEVAMLHLHPRRRYALIEHFQRGRNYREISVDMKVSHERVRQLAEKARELVRREVLYGEPGDE